MKDRTYYINKDKGLLRRYGENHKQWTYSLILNDWFERLIPFSELNHSWSEITEEDAEEWILQQTLKQ